MLSYSRHLLVLCLFLNSALFFKSFRFGFILLLNSFLFYNYTTVYFLMFSLRNIKVIFYFFVITKTNITEYSYVCLPTYVIEARFLG